jgi:hypothetical protein
MSASKWTGYFKVVSPKPQTTSMTDSQEMTDVGAYNNYTWYQRLVQGSASRMTRYREYDLMDNDVEVARALDTIAEEMTGNNPKTHELLEVDILNDAEASPNSLTVVTLKMALRRFAKMHDFDVRLFKIARMVVKYGDVFFRKREVGTKWEFVHPKNVIAALVDAVDATKVIAWQIKNDVKRPRMNAYSLPLGAKQDTQYDTELVDANQIVRFSINDDMSDTQPFGESVLRPVYRSHKQKELLEDAVIIYRIQRAPERRVFYIDVGKMPPQRVKTYLENIKNEIKQKKIPNMNGGSSEVDSTYNPQSMSEDFFFASRPEGRGSRVETLPGGQGLGELADLEYFQRKVWRGLRVPASYMIEQQEGGQIWNDGKVGVAYIQELRFYLFCLRLQTYVERSIDAEFKKYLKQCNVNIDESMYCIRLPEPSNFGKYRQQQLDSSILTQYGSADAITSLSKRFIMQRYLYMSDEEIAINERLKREELGLDPDGGKEDLQAIYGAPAEGMAGGAMPGGFGGEPMPMMAGDEMGAEGGDMGGAEMGAAPGTTGSDNVAR